MSNKVPPGWNDPPPVSVNYQASGPGSKSRLLNKRVPFNFSSSSSPLPATTVSRISQLPESTQCETVTLTTDVNKLQEPLELSKVMEKLLNVVETMENNKEKQDILKRLDVMKNMWEANELNAEVQRQISDFSDYLEEKNVQPACDIVLALTVNNAVVCSSWIIGFKYLVHTLCN